MGKEMNNDKWLMNNGKKYRHKNQESRQKTKNS